MLAFLFEAMSTSLREAFDEPARPGAAWLHPRRAPSSLAHQAVLDAIRAGNERAAGEAHASSIADTERDVRSHVKAHWPRRVSGTSSAPGSDPAPPSVDATIDGSSHCLQALRK